MSKLYEGAKKKIEEKACGVLKTKYVCIELGKEGGWGLLRKLTEGCEEARGIEEKGASRV